MAEGIRLTREGDLGGAEPQLLKALQQDPDNLRVLDALGFVYGHTDRWQKAEETYRRMLVLAPGAPGALYGLSNTLSDMGRYQEALDTLNELLRRDPENPQARLKEAMLLDRLGRPQEAERSARALTGRDPKNAEAWYVLGLALQDLGDMPGAAAALEQTTALQPDHVGALNRLAAVYARLGRQADATRAREAHQAALSRQRVEERVRDHRVRGVEAFNRQDYAGALAEFAIIAREDPKDPQVYLYTGSALMALGRYDEARAALTRSLDLQPRNERTLMELGRLEALQEHLDAAVARLRQAIAVNPEFAEPHYFLAGIHTARGETDAARSEMSRFEELKARSPGAAMELAGPPQAMPR
jgi:tetratricopeptide (TPR) repeat protein